MRCDGEGSRAKRLRGEQKEKRPVFGTLCNIFADKPENSVYVIKWEFMYQLIFHPQMTQIAQILFFLRKRYFPALSCALHLRCIVIRVICVICG